jgi:signal transduction histidine kinase
MNSLSELLKSIAVGQLPTAIPEDCPHPEEVRELLGYLTDITRFVRAMSTGDLSAKIDRRGPLSGSLKALHANLRHLSWQTQQVAAGDFAQRVDFLGEFSIAFNSMVEALAQARDDLLSKNQELAKTLDDLKSIQMQLLQQAKMASVGQLAAGVAHEINNPMSFIASNLNSLLSYSQALMEYAAVTDQLAAKSPEQERSAMAALRTRLDLDFIVSDLPDLIDESIKGATRVKNIVQALKRFSNVDHSGLQMTDINDCLENTLAAAGNTLGTTTVLLRDYGQLPLVVCQVQDIGQLFLNLLLNAAQAIAPGGEIRVSTRPNGESVLITIADNGCGIPADIIDRIFEPFFTTREVGKGTGLGLAICYDIAEKHQGAICVDSSVDVGTAFTVRLPVKPRGNEPKERFVPT